MRCSRAELQRTTESWRGRRSGRVFCSGSGGPFFWSLVLSKLKLFCLFRKPEVIDRSEPRSSHAMGLPTPKHCLSDSPSSAPFWLLQESLEEEVVRAMIQTTELSGLMEPLHVCDAAGIFIKKRCSFLFLCFLGFLWVSIIQYIPTLLQKS